VPSFRRRASVIDDDHVDQPKQDPDRSADAADALALAEEADAEAAEAEATAAAARARARAIRLRRQAAAEVEGVEIFHAGTKADGGRILANGGRVLNVSALGKTVAQAQARAYQAVDRIRWADGFCRRDIGFRAVERERKA